MGGIMSTSSSETDTLAITEFKDDAFIFRWNVGNFRDRIQDKDPKAELRSPVFNSGAEGNAPEWQLIIKWNKKEKRSNSDEKDDLLSLFVYLSNANKSKATKAAVHFEILDVDLNSWKNVFLGECLFKSTTSGFGYDKFAKIQELLDSKNKLLNDDTLKLQCKITTKRDTSEEVNGTKFEAKRKSLKRKHDLISDFTNLFNSPSFTDVSIQTKSSTLKAHKDILSCRSPVFAAMFQNNMTESIDNIVKILDFDHEVVKGMLQYIYCGELAQEFLTRKSIALLQIADKYDIKGLKEDAEETIAMNLSVANVADSLILADMNNALNLKSKAMKFINSKKAEMKKTEGFQKILNYNRFIYEELYLLAE